MRHRGKRISTLGARLTSMVSIALVLVLLGLAAMGGVAARELGDRMRRNTGMVVVMQQECLPDQINALKTCLTTRGEVATFTFSSAEDILAAESEYLGQDIAAIAEGNPYSPEFDVKVLPAYASVDSMAPLQAILADMPGVQGVESESAEIEGVDNLVRRGALILTAVGALLLIVAIALIGNTVSLSIYGRRFIIHTMRLVGATGAFIRRPFMLAALRDGAISGAVAAAAILLLRHYAVGLDPIVAEYVALDVAIWLCVAMIFVGAAITTLTAMIVANRYLRASYDELFLK